jgi:signal transduction histidine kinase
LLELVNAILDLSRMEAGQLSISSALVELIGGLLAAVSDAERDGGVTVSVDLPR